MTADEKSIARFLDYAAAFAGSGYLLREPENSKIGIGGEKGIGDQGSGIGDGNSNDSTTSGVHSDTSNNNPQSLVASPQSPVFPQALVAETVTAEEDEVYEQDDEADSGEEAAREQDDEAGSGEDEAREQDDEAGSGEEAAREQDDEAGSGEDEVREQDDEAGSGEDEVREQVDEAGSGEDEVCDPDGANDSLRKVAEDVKACTLCRLCENRKNAVPGEGVPNPVVMVIGEGPGADEDASGRPFVGRAGQLLDKMLASIGLSRKSNCFIANIIKCRPPANRDPLPDEAALCALFLERQIRLLNPRFILCAGRIAAQTLLHTTETIGRLRGRFIKLDTSEREIPLIATYHPAAIIRNEDLKRPAWEDLKILRSAIEG